MSILTNDAVKILCSDWISPIIVDRENEKKELENLVFNTLKNEKIPLSVYVYGASGTGKTFLIKKLLQDYYDEIKRRLPKFEFVYLNMSEHHPSINSVWSLLCYHLRNYLPVNVWGETITKIPKRGYSTQLYMDLTRELIKQNGLTVLLVLDEVDKIKEVDTVMYQMFYAYTEFRDEPEHVGLSAVCISNKLKLLNMLSPSTKSRISHVVTFNDYGVHDIFKILKVHAQQSLKEGTYTDEDLFKISAGVHSYTTDIRFAKRVLFNLGKICEGVLDTNLLGRAIKETERDLLHELLSSLSFHTKIILVGIIKRLEFLEKLHKEGTQKYGLFRRLENLPTAMSIYKVYKEICKKFNEKPKSYNAFFSTLNDLENKGLIIKSVQSFGRARGLTTIINLTDDLNEVKSRIIL